MLLTISVGFLVGLAIPNPTICNSDLDSAIKKDDAKKFNHLLSHAYPEPESSTSEPPKKEIGQQLKRLQQLAKERKSALNKRKNNLQEKKFFFAKNRLFTIDTKSINKSKDHATWGAFWLAGSVIGAALTLFADKLDPVGPNLGDFLQLLPIPICAYKLLYKTPKHLWKGLVSPEKRIDKKLQCNQAIINAIEETEKKLGLSNSE